MDSTKLKAKVKGFWEDETCGTRYGASEDRKAYFEQIDAMRYKYEPYIFDLADFASAKGKRVLEVGVGAGSDFQNWCQHAKHATGIDLTERAISLTRERLQASSISEDRYTLQTADAEHLPFEDSSFDIVYTYGVLICTPDTERAYRECFRVLKSGGIIKTMVYRVPSWVGLMLYVRYGLLSGQFQLSTKEAISRHLESPGTKAYTNKEGVDLLKNAGFTDISWSTKLCSGDTLELMPSRKYRSAFYKLVWALYPTWLVRVLGDRYGLHLLLSAKKV